MKKILALLLVALMVFALTACGSSEKDVKDAVTEAVEDVKDAAEDVKDAAEDAVEEAADAVEEAAEAVGEAVDDAKEAVEEAVEGAKDAAEEAVEEATEAVEEAKDTAEAAVEEATEAAEEVAEEATEAVEEAVEEATEAAEEVAEEAAEAVEEAAEEAEEAAEPAAVAADLTMGTGGEAGTYYAFGGVLGSYIGQNTDIKINVVSSGGSAANITGIVQEGTYDLATVQSDVMTYAYNGTNAFEEGGAMSDFRVLGGLYAETVQVVTCNPEITSVADLAGKSISVGDVGSGTYFNTVDILAAYDMTIDDVNPVYQSFADSAESLKDGKIDAAVITAGAPTTAVVDLATSNSVYLVSIDDEHMEKLLTDCPWYASYTIPAGTYNGFDQDAVTVTVKATLVCRADLDDDVAYAIVSTIFDNTEAITELHAKGAELSLEFATDGIAVPFAKGAAKYFAENGIEVETVD